eukprot:12367708-Prorocentrum_lima.AAC.1
MEHVRRQPGNLTCIVLGSINRGRRALHHLRDRRQLQGLEQDGQWKGVGGQHWHHASYAAGPGAA